MLCSIDVSPSPCWQLVVQNQNIRLTHFSHMLHLYTTLKGQKAKGFLDTFMRYRNGTFG